MKKITNNPLKLHNKIQINPEEIQRSLESKKPAQLSIYALKFDVVSEILTENGKQFYEVIRKGSISEEVLRSSTIVSLVEHDNFSEYGTLAQHNGVTDTMKLTVDDIGLKAEFEIPTDTDKGLKLVEAIRSGELAFCSFRAIATEGFYTEHKGLPLREITRFSKFKDVSLTGSPAYLEAQVETIRNNVDNNNIVNDMYKRQLAKIYL